MHKARISMRRECLLHMGALHCECASYKGGCLSVFAFNYYVALPPACWGNQGIAGRAAYADFSMYAQDIRHVGIVRVVVPELVLAMISSTPVTCQSNLQQPPRLCWGGRATASTPRHGWSGRATHQKNQRGTRGITWGSKCSHWRIAQPCRCSPWRIIPPRLKLNPQYG